MSESAHNPTLLKRAPSSIGQEENSRDVLSAEAMQESKRQKSREIREKAEQKEKEAVARFAAIEEMIPNCNEHSQAIFNKFQNDNTFSHLLQASALKIAEMNTSNTDVRQEITAEMVDQVLEMIDINDDLMSMCLKLIPFVKTRNVKKVKNIDIQSVTATFSKLKTSLLEKLEKKDSYAYESARNAANLIYNTDIVEMSKLVKDNPEIFGKTHFIQLINEHGSLEETIDYIEEKITQFPTKDSQNK